MRRFVTWSIHIERGFAQFFRVRQTPEEIADETAHALTAPTYLTPGAYFSLGVWELPEGKDLRLVPEDDPSRNSFMHVGGSYQAMTVELRVPDPHHGYTQYTVARQPVTDPHAWVPISWGDGDDLVTVHVHPEEVFTGHQAAPLFRAYILHDTTPPPHLLRQLDI
ncbi:NTP pyrophosphohydrolase [Actinomyces wuliandei]|uniref:NTP pyrophosphohydrolase n=1 Tax=Actinomyces wuliandei TaxID=2057743 RepID=UPI00111ADAE9|nr:NTP pyrophosphohydrolase [Actinomyces wuliandei]